MEAVLNTSLLLIVSKGWSLSGHIIGEVLDESPERSLISSEDEDIVHYMGNKKKKSKNESCTDELITTHSKNR